jgi:hypothetical protein
MPVLIVIGLVLLVAGFLTASQATVGVYLAASACFFAILARIAQARVQHQEILRTTAPQALQRSPAQVALIWS